MKSLTMDIILLIIKNIRRKILRKLNIKRKRRYDT